ncbi:phosphodiester glycosidase family protein [Dinghuibacter silviterrae]|uniref:phosphodiester glycosidase family protein n=1 Tax=Dinghuibacter silviterrae TaxID=1539049 RepID=UPI0013C351FE|nr:phosphodiester glycosidase family protein [Dinghuibacter silviterrae]
MYKILFLLLLPSAALAPLAGSAQLHWLKARSLNEQLPFSITVYLTEDSVHGRPFRACYVSVDPYDLKIDFAARVGEATPSAFFGRETGLPPYIVVNGETRRDLQLVIDGRRLVSYNQMALRVPGDSLYHYVTPSAVGVNGARHVDVGWVFTDSTKDYPLCMLKGPSDPRYSKGVHSNPSILDIRSENANSEIGAKCMQWPMEAAVGGGPTLVKRGQVFISSREEIRFFGREDSVEARTAMGYTRDNKMIILVVEGGHPGESLGASLPEVAAMMKDLGCWEALNLGGGGATCLLVNGQPLLKPATANGEQEAVGSVFMIKSHL